MSKGADVNAIGFQQFDENRVGLDHLGFSVESRAKLDDQIEMSPSANMRKALALLCTVCDANTPRLTG